MSLLMKCVVNGCLKEAKDPSVYCGNHPMRQWFEKVMDRVLSVFTGGN
jgi:hypothetical protein